MLGQMVAFVKPFDFQVFFQFKNKNVGFEEESD